MGGTQAPSGGASLGGVTSMGGTFVGGAPNGCEANVSTSPDNCTGCGLACSSNHVPVRTCHDACDGACEAGFQDCNGDKLKDGCETSTSADLKNCGGCNLTCSSNHVTASCAAGACAGACAANYADCNLNKRVDGCEVNTQADKLNCGECGKVCADGLACAGGKCTSLYTFTGIAQNLPIASLAGWSQCFVEPFGQVGTSIEKVKLACSGSQLMMACRLKGSDTLQLAAYAPRADVLTDTGIQNVLHVANGVGWYFSDTWSWGFAPPNESVERNNCDVGSSAGDQRMCWHTLAGGLDGGYRCGNNEDLNSSFDFERLLFQVP